MNLYQESLCLFVSEIYLFICIKNLCDYLYLKYVYLYQESLCLAVSEIYMFICIYKSLCVYQESMCLRICICVSVSRIHEFMYLNLCICIKNPCVYVSVSRILIATFVKSIYKFGLSVCLSVCLFVCLFVCLYPINVKTAEPIGPKFFVGHHVIPGKVYE